MLTIQSWRCLLCSLVLSVFFKNLFIPLRSRLVGRFKVCTIINILQFRICPVPSELDSSSMNYKFQYPLLWLREAEHVLVSFNGSWHYKPALTTGTAEVGRKKAPQTWTGGPDDCPYRTRPNSHMGSRVWGRVWMALRHN